MDNQVPSSPRELLRSSRLDQDGQHWFVSQSRTLQSATRPLPHSTGDAEHGLAHEGITRVLPGSQGSGLEVNRRRYPRSSNQKEDGQAGIVHYGTEVVTDADRSISALLGASPGASVSVHVMLEVIRKCFSKLLQSESGIEP